MLRRNIIIFILIVFFTSCKNSDWKYNPQNHAEKAAEGAKKFQFKLKLFKGDKYYFTNLNDSKTTFKVNDNDQKISNSYTIGLLYEVIRNAADTIFLKITYDKLHIESENKEGEKQVFDAENTEGAFDSMDKTLAGIKGMPVFVAISSKGNIFSVTGSKEINDKVMGSLTTNDLALRSKVQELLNQLTGNDFVKTNLGQSILVLPDTALYIGDSWEKKSKETTSISFEATTQYILTSVDDRVAEVRVNGTVTNTGDKKTNLMGNDVTADLKGSQEGEMHVDANTAMLINSKLATKIEGTIEVMGKLVPVKIATSKKTTVKKL